MERHKFSDAEVSGMRQCEEHGKGRKGVEMGTPWYDIKGNVERMQKDRRLALFPSPHPAQDKYGPVV